MSDHVSGIDGFELTEQVVNSGAGSCYALHSQNANCRTCGYLKDISARKVAA